MDNCPFCAIAVGKLPADVIYEDSQTLVFRDIAPQAPIHCLVIPKEHIQSAQAVVDFALWGALMRSLRVSAERLGVAETGYRIVVNCGEAVGQTVPHLHIHLLSGRSFHWPPG